MTRVGRHTVGKALPSRDVVSCYEAVHDEAGDVYLRVLEADLQPTEDDIVQFAAEAALAKQMRVPAAVNLIDWGIVDKIHVSTKFVYGKSLAEIAEAAPEHRLSASATIGLGMRMAETLDAIHAVGLVHSGVSDRSVLLGPGGDPILTDFVMARLLTNLLSGYSMVLKSIVKGLAPEQITAPDQVGPHTDVFSLGVVLYRACTGQEPFDAPSPLGRSLRVTMSSAEPIDGHGVSIPPALGAIVMRMLSTAPRGRPTMPQVAARLRGLAEEHGRWRGGLAAALEAAGGLPDLPAESIVARKPIPRVDPPEDTDVDTGETVVSLPEPLTGKDGDEPITTPRLPGLGVDEQRLDTKPDVALPEADADVMLPLPDVALPITMPHEVSGGENDVLWGQPTLVSSNTEEPLEITVPHVQMPDPELPPLFPSPTLILREPPAESPKTMLLSKAALAGEAADVDEGEGTNRLLMLVGWSLAIFVISLLLGMGIYLITTS